SLHERVVSLRHELDEVQKALDKEPLSKLLRDEEAVYLKSFNEAVLDQERFLRQKAKVEWLHGFRGDATPLDTRHLFLKKLISSKADHMIRKVKNKETKTAMFDIGNDKAPCPDGYASVFSRIRGILLGMFVTQFETSSQMESCFKK
nr:hypothetical protein [Tanacetum cinerariifolium]